MSQYDSENQGTKAPTKEQHDGDGQGVTNDAVFGTMQEGGPNYRNVCAGLLVKMDKAT